MATASLARYLANWAKLSNSMRQGVDTQDSLEALCRMVDAAERDSAAARQSLGGLIAKTEALYPGVGDPLTAKLDSDSHRWLAADREESYSDWLAWILERQDNPSLVLALFGMESHLEISGEWRVKREVVTRYGRLDLLLQHPELGVVCVEIKTESEPGSDQLERYLSWLSEQRRSHGLVLLAIERPDNALPEQCRFCAWKDVSLRLRTWASAWLFQPARLYDAVMTLAFCGAIERNLLSLDTAGLNALRTTDYLEEILAYAKTPTRK